MYSVRSSPAPEGDESEGGGDGQHERRTNEPNDIDGDRRRFLYLGGTALGVGSAGCLGRGTDDADDGAASRPPPTVTNASLSDTTVFVGQPVEVTATVTNGGERKDTLYAELRVDGMIVDTTDVTLAAGETASVTFTRSFDTPGEYRMSVNDATGGAVVVERRPAAFEIRNASLSTGTIRVGKPIEVTATITNVGGQQGTFTAELRVNGTIADTTDVTLAAGASTSVTFTRSFDTPGEYRMSVNDATAGSVRVERPPAFEVGNTLVDATRVTTDEDVTVVATVSNVGGQEGTFTAELERDGETIATRAVTVAAGERTTVRFLVSFGERGAYALSVNGVAVDTVYVVECSTVVDERITVASRSSRTYRYRLKERAEMTVTVTARSGVKPTVSVVGPSGEPVIDGVTGGSIHESFTAATAGTYRIRVENDALLPLRNGTWDIEIEICTW